MDYSSAGVSAFVRLSTYSATDSTSRTKRVLSFDRNDETTLNTASLKPPIFRMSSRFGAWLDPFLTNCCHSVITPVDPRRPYPYARPPVIQLSLPLTRTQPTTLAVFCPRVSNRATCRLKLNRCLTREMPMHLLEERLRVHKAACEITSQPLAAVVIPG